MNGMENTNKSRILQTVNINKYKNYCKKASESALVCEMKLFRWGPNNKTRENNCNKNLMVKELK